MSHPSKARFQGRGEGNDLISYPPSLTPSDQLPTSPLGFDGQDGGQVSQISNLMNLYPLFPPCTFHFPLPLSLGNIKIKPFPGGEMTAIRYLPPIAVVVTEWRLQTGHIRFHGDRVGKILTMEDGEVHAVFREVRVASSKSVPAESMTVLKVRFKFASFSPTVNRRLSLIPIPVITGMLGFRQKTWTFSEESGYSQGIYQFESMEMTEGYMASPVMRILEKRSAPGSTSYELLPGTLIEEYLKSREQ